MADAQSPDEIGQSADMIARMRQIVPDGIKAACDRMQRDVVRLAPPFFDLLQECTTIFNPVIERSTRLAEEFGRDSHEMFERTRRDSALVSAKLEEGIRLMRAKQPLPPLGDQAAARAAEQASQTMLSTWTEMQALSAEALVASSAASNSILTILLPTLKAVRLYPAKEEYAPSSTRKRLSGIGVNLLGLVPGLGEFLTAAAVGKELYDWATEQVEFDVQMKRQESIVAFQGFLDWLGGTGTESLKQIESNWRQQARIMSAKVDKLEELHLSARAVVPS